MYGIRVAGDSGELQIDGSHKAIHLVWSGPVRIRSWASDGSEDAGYQWYDLGAPQWVANLPEKIIVIRPTRVSLNVASLSWYQNPSIPSETPYPRLVIGQHAMLDVLPGYGWVEEDVEVYIFTPQRIDKGPNGFGLRALNANAEEIYHSDDYPLSMAEAGLPIGMDHAIPGNVAKPALLISSALPYRQTGDPQSIAGFIGDLLRITGSNVVSTKWSGSSSSPGRGTFSIVDVARLPIPYVSPQF